MDVFLGKTLVEAKKITEATSHSGLWPLEVGHCCLCLDGVTDVRAHSLPDLFWVGNSDIQLKCVSTLLLLFLFLRLRMCLCMCATEGQLSTVKMKYISSHKMLITQISTVDGQQAIFGNTKCSLH